MFDVVNIISTILTTFAAGGWITSRWMRKKEEEKHEVELEQARAEADALRQRTELDYTKEILEIYSAHIVQPLKDEIKRTNQRIDNYEIAIRQSHRCANFDSCPIVEQLQNAPIS